MRTVLCTGSRMWIDEGLIHDAMISIRRPFRIIVGDEPNGADRIFWKVATNLDLPRLKYKANWTLEGKAAGPLRNGRMRDSLVALRARGVSCFVLAAWDGRTTGTKNMIDQARKANFQVWRISAHSL